MAEKTKDAFEVLNGVNTASFTEKKGNLTYLSWPYAYAEARKRFPDLTYEIVKFDGLPYVYDARTGYLVYTRVTIGGETHEMWLPVMDGSNNAMKAEPYELKTRYGMKEVAAATMFDINKTIMRCLVKNLAMFGLGLNIYAGEDLPLGDDAEGAQQAQPAPAKAATPSRAQQSAPRAAQQVSPPAPAPAPQTPPQAAQAAPQAVPQRTLETANAAKATPEMISAFIATCKEKGIAPALVFQHPQFVQNGIRNVNDLTVKWYRNGLWLIDKIAEKRKTGAA